jgi:hypothetical protein
MDRIQLKVGQVWLTRNQQYRLTLEEVRPDGSGYNIRFSYLQFSGGYTGNLIWNVRWNEGIWEQKGQSYRGFDLMGLMYDPTA